MKFEDVLNKYLMSESADDGLCTRIARRNSLYKGSGEIINKNTGKRVQAECHQNMVFELIESQINNAIPDPVVTPTLVEDVQRAGALVNYLTQEMIRVEGIEINDRAERGTYKNGYHFYHIEWDDSAKNNSGYGALKLSELPAGSVKLQPGIMKFDQAEYCYIETVATIQSLKRLFKKDVVADTNSVDVATIVTCYYLNEDGDLGRTIFTKTGYEILAEDNYYELRRVAVCAECETPLLNLDLECPVCGSKESKWVIIDETLATQDIYMGDFQKNAELRAQAQMMGEEVDPYVGLEKVVSQGDPIPVYHIRELPLVMRISIGSDDGPYGISDIDMIEQNQDTLNRLTTKQQENLLKAGSFVTYPKGVKIPNDDSTLKLVPISDPRLIDAFTVQTVQANMQQDDIFASRMYQYGRATLGITESYQGKRDTTATSGRAKQMSAAQSASRLESKQRMKVQAYGNVYRVMFKFLLAYADETQHYIKYTNDNDILQMSFNRYMFLKKGEDGRLYWNDNFIISADNASLVSNKSEMWEVITQQFLAGTIGNPQDPSTMKLYWRIMKQLQFPFAIAVEQDLLNRENDLPPEVKAFIMQNPDILDTIATMMADNKAQQNMSMQPKMKTGPNAMIEPEVATPQPDRSPAPAEAEEAINADNK